MSSAYANTFTDILPILHPQLLEETANNSGLTYLVNKYGDKTPPCLVPLPTVNELDLVLFHSTEMH